MHEAKTNDSKSSEGTGREKGGLDRHLGLILLEDWESQIEVVSRTDTL